MDILTPRKNFSGFSFSENFLPEKEVVEKFAPIICFEAIVRKPLAGLSSGNKTYFMKKTLSTLIITGLFFAACSVDNKDDDDFVWPDKGDIELDVLFDPPLQDEEFYIKWEFPGSRDNFLFEDNVNNGAIFSFKEEDFTLNYGYSQIFLVYPSVGSIDTNSDTKTCYNVTLVMRYAGKEYDKESWSVGKNSEKKLDCDVEGLTWSRGLPPL